MDTEDDFLDEVAVEEYDDGYATEENPVLTHNRPIDTTGTPIGKTKMYISGKNMRKLLDISETNFNRQLLDMEYLHDIIREHENLFPKNKRNQGQRRMSVKGLQDRYLQNQAFYEMPSKVELKNFEEDRVTIHYSHRCARALNRLEAFPPGLLLTDEIEWFWGYLFWKYIQHQVRDGFDGWKAKLEAEVKKADQKSAKTTEKAEKRTKKNAARRIRRKMKGKSKTSAEVPVP